MSGPQPVKASVRSGGGRRSRRIRPLEHAGRPPKSAGNSLKMGFGIDGERGWSVICDSAGRGGGGDEG